MSALVDKIYTLGNLIEFNENGLSIASFVDIKRTLIDRQRQLYGLDIDVSDASADGQWITEIALLLNNILQAFNNLYSSLNPAVAQGAALDLLASFSNIARKPATKSICYITITNNAAFSLDASSEFIDKNGNVWEIDKSRTELLPQLSQINTYDYSSDEMQDGQTVPLICEAVGAIAIPANSILNFINITNDNSLVMISQPEAGIIGSIAESDAHLRARRNHSAANEAVTIIEGIQGALLNNINVIDAIVINHTTNGADGTGINAHTVEVITRTKYAATNANNVPNNLMRFIADTIYNRLTPGIPTTYDRSTTYSESHLTYNILREFSESILADTPFMKIVQWVDAVPITPKITVNIHTLANCNKPQVAELVIKAIVDYANNLGLLVDLSASALLQEILFADPKFQGRMTYYCSPADIQLNNHDFTFKPSKSNDAMDVSAQARKTYYAYDDDVYKDENDDLYYNNTDYNAATIIISFDITAQQSENE